MARTLTTIRADLSALMSAHAQTPDPDFATKQAALFDEYRSLAKTQDAELAAQEALNKVVIMDHVASVQKYIGDNINKRTYLVQRHVRDMNGNIELLMAESSAGLAVISGDWQPRESTLNRIGVRLG